jgi:hypothetical protein
MTTTYLQHLMKLNINMIMEFRRKSIICLKSADVIGHSFHQWVHLKWKTEIFQIISNRAEIKT